MTAAVGAAGSIGAKTAPAAEMPEATAAAEFPTSMATPSVRAVRLGVDGLKATTSITSRPGDPGALYLTEQSGKVLRIEPPAISATNATAGSTPDTDLKPVTVLDVSSQTKGAGEQGLLGLAFNRDGTKLYVNFTAADDGATRVVEYTISGQNAGDARPLLEIAQPFPNHNGGQLVWGPDDLLWIGMGDGGLANDPEGNGQDTDTLLGAILRIDPTKSATTPYTVPADNPVLGSRPEIWAYGVRNPWRFSFDRKNGDLWIADVGQNLWEEINWLSAKDGAGKGANLGWNRREGAHEFADGKDPASEPGDMVDPVYEYAHGPAGCSVTGGFVYRGSAIPDLVGTYVYGDFCAKGLRGLRPAQDGTVSPIDLGTTIGSISTFGEDADGELYVATLTGELYRVESR